MVSVSVIFIIALFLVIPASAQILNGGFETGDLTDWTVVNGSVEVLQAGNFDPNIDPPEGQYFALLSTFKIGDLNALSGPLPRIRSLSTLQQSSQDRDTALGNEFDIAVLRQEFSVNHNAIVSFKLSFLTSEADGGEYEGVPEFDDIFEVTIDGKPVVQGSVDKLDKSGVPPGSASFFPDYGPYDGVYYAVASPGPAAGSVFNDGRTDFTTYSVMVPPGTHTIEFYLGDQSDENVDSGILIDDVKVSAPVPVLSTTGEILMAALLSVFGLISMRTWKKRFN